MGNKAVTFIIVAVLLVSSSLAMIVYKINSPERRIEKRLEIARELFENGEYAKAIEEFKGVLSIDPKNIEAHDGIIESYIEYANATDNIDEAKEKYYKSAVEYADALIKMYPDNETVQVLLIDTYFAIANYYFNVHDYENARIYYNMILEFEFIQLFSEKQNYAIEQLGLIDQYTEKQGVTEIEMMQKSKSDLLEELFHEKAILDSLLPRHDFDGVITNKTVSELEEIYRPHVDNIENIVSELDIDETIQDVFLTLENVYKLLNNLDRLMEVRKIYYELNGNPKFNPDGGEDENGVFNEFGAYVVFGNDSIFEYDGTNLVSHTYHDVVTEYSYDDTNRLQKGVTIINGRTKDIRTWTYSGNTAIEKLEDIDQGIVDDDFLILTFDDYGRMIHSSMSVQSDEVGNDIAPREEKDY